MKRPATAPIPAPPTAPLRLAEPPRDTDPVRAAARALGYPHSLRLADLPRHQAHREARDTVRRALADALTASGDGDGLVLVRNQLRPIPDHQLLLTLITIATPAGTLTVPMICEDALTNPRTLAAAIADGITGAVAATNLPRIPGIAPRGDLRVHPHPAVPTVDHDTTTTVYGYPHARHVAHDLALLANTLAADLRDQLHTPRAPRTSTPPVAIDADLPDSLFAVASDASRHPSGRHGPTCSAWVTQTGHGAIAVLSPNTSVLAAELSGVLGALRAVPNRLRHRGPGVLVLTDSLDAVYAVRRARRRQPLDLGDSFAEHLAGRVAATIADQYTAPVHIRHVRGHNGHPLNEAADSLARNARIADHGDPGIRPFTELEERIARTGADAYRADLERTRRGAA